MTEDFIIEEESESPSNRRPFLIAVGVLLTIFVLSAICSATLLYMRSGDTADANADQIATIEAQNAIVAVTNEAVTATIAAMETAAAMPTNTPAAPATNTPAPTNTPLPTNTPVVKQAEDAASETVEAAVTDSASDDGDSDDSTPTPISALGGTNGGDDSLPQTGIETWGAFVAALALIVIFFSARRLRSG